jgi:hypothetical protein
MKTLVIPDIHQKTHLVESILKEEKDFDEAIFLGDWFDSFQEPPVVTSFGDTCKYLKHLVMEHPQKDKFVFLLGNHDISYIYYNNGPENSHFPEIDGYFCSGFTKEKAQEFRKHFFDQGLKDDFFLKNFKIAHRSQNITFSHAGLHPDYVPPSLGIKKVVEEVLPDVWQNFRNLDHPKNTVLSGAGYARYGNVPIGGALWLDWRVEFKTSEDIGRQVVGHTTVKEPSCLHMNSPLESWNLDTEKDFGVVLNGKLSTKPIQINKRKKDLAKRAKEARNLQQFILYMEGKEG